MAFPQPIGQRVVVTGVGILSPIGNSPDEFWEALLRGRCGIKPITAWDTTGYPSRFAGIVEGFDARNYLDRQEARRTDRFTHFGVAAAMEALANSGLNLDKIDRERAAVSIGTAVAGMGMVESESRRLAETGPRRANPMLIPSIIGNMASCLLSIQLGLRGPALCPTGACATGCMGIAEGFSQIAGGDMDVVFAGGAESVVTPLAVAAFGRLGALSRREDSPELACRPFDVDRDGTILAEGAAVLVLESERHALARGAAIVGELAGCGITADAYHVAAPDPNGSGAARAMRSALGRAGIEAGDVDYVCAHGTGTPLNDISEARGIREVLGDKAASVPVSSNKYAIGHTLGAAGAISAVAAIKAIAAGVIPGTLNLRQRDPECPVNAIAANVEAKVDVALVNAFGFGGQNASLVFRRWRN